MPLEALCKGDWSIGTACGACSRCLESAPRYIAHLHTVLKDGRPWDPIDSAPKGRDVRIDILGKIWVQETDKFQFSRFSDCYWSEGDPTKNTKDKWIGLDPGYRAVAWMPAPKIPETWP